MVKSPLLTISLVVSLSGQRRFHIDHHTHESYLHHRLAGPQERNGRRVVTRIVRARVNSHEVEGIGSRGKIYPPLLPHTVDPEGLTENLRTNEEPMHLDIELSAYRGHEARPCHAEPNPQRAT